MFLLCLPYFAVLFARKAVEMVTQRAGRVDVYFREGCCEAGGEAMLRLGVGISGTRSVPVPGSRQRGQDGAGWWWGRSGTCGNSSWWPAGTRPGVLDARTPRSGISPCPRPTRSQP